MAATSGEWTLYYHQLAGRGEFIRIVFEDVGVKYKEINDNVVELVNKGKAGGYPSFAPPMIKEGSFSLAQTPVICQYLGKLYKLYPESEEDQWHAQQVNATIHDYLGEGALIFHGAGFMESYADQKERTQHHIDWFLAGRMAHWLTYFESVLASNTSGQGFVIGDKCTYVDLALLHVLRVTASQFPEAWEEEKGKHPILNGFKTSMENRPNLKAYFQSSRCRPFSGNSMM